MNIVICDDVKSDGIVTAKMLYRFFEWKRIPLHLVLYDNARSLLEDEHIYDLYFLDIMLGDVNGIEIAGKIIEKRKKAAIFLLSASNEFILDGYKVRAIRYFLKPLIWEEFSFELNEVLNYLTADESYIIIDSGSNEKIFLSAILFLEKIDRKVIVHTYENNYVSNRSITDWFSELRDVNFVIPYKGIIVNVENIKRIEKKAIVLKNDIELPVSRNYMKSVKEKFKKYIFEESRMI